MLDYESVFELRPGNKLLDNLLGKHEKLGFMTNYTPYQEELFRYQVMVTAQYAANVLDSLASVVAGSANPYIYHTKEQALESLRIMPMDLAGNYAVIKYDLPKIFAEMDFYTFHFFEPGTKDNFVFLFPPLIGSKTINRLRKIGAESAVETTRIINKNITKDELEKLFNEEMEKSDKEIINESIRLKIASIKYGVLRFLGFSGIEEKSHNVSVVHEPLLDREYNVGSRVKSSDTSTLSKLVTLLISLRVSPSLTEKLLWQKLNDNDFDYFDLGGQPGFCSWLVPIVKQKLGGLSEGTDFLTKLYFGRNLNESLDELAQKIGIPRTVLGECFQRSDKLYSQYRGRIEESGMLQSNKYLVEARASIAKIQETAIGSFSP